MKFIFKTRIEIDAKDEDEAFIKLENYLNDLPDDEVFDMEIITNSNRGIYQNSRKLKNRVEG